MGKYFMAHPNISNLSDNGYTSLFGIGGLKFYINLTIITQKKCFINRFLGSLVFDNINSFGPQSQSGAELESGEENQKHSKT